MKPATIGQLTGATQFLHELNALAIRSGYHLDAHMEMHVTANDDDSETLEYLFGVRWNGSEYVLERPIT